MPNNSNNCANPIWIRTNATRQTIHCKIPGHFQQVLQASGHRLDSYTPDKKFLKYLGVTGKRFHQLMRGESNFLFSEACAYAHWFKLPVSDLYTFLTIKASKN